MLTPLFSYSGDSCLKCGRGRLPLDDSDFDSYFNGGKVQCPHCRHIESAWTLLRRRLREEHPLAPGAIGLGVASVSMGKLLLVNGRAVDLDLAEFGVPSEAQVLGLTFSPYMTDDGGALAPTLVQQTLTRAPVPHVLHLIGWPVVGNPETAEVGVQCIWLNSQFEPGMEPLIGAIEAFSNKEYRAAIIPAMVAVEAKLKSVLADHFAAYGAKDKVENFLTSTSLGPQLSFLLPSLMTLVDAPPLTKEVKQQLATLRSFRNKVAHLHEPMTGPDTADALLGAIFGYRYLRLYGGRLRADI